MLDALHRFLHNAMHRPSVWPKRPDEFGLPVEELMDFVDSDRADRPTPAGRPQQTSTPAHRTLRVTAADGGLTGTVTRGVHGWTARNVDGDEIGTWPRRRTATFHLLGIRDPIDLPGRRPGWW